MTLQVSWDGLISATQAFEASKHFRCMEGRVIVECPPIQDKIGSVWIPDATANIRPDVGRVIASQMFPGKARKWRSALPLVGDAVIMDARDGIWLEDFQLGSYKTKNRVKVFGAYCEYAGNPQRCHPCDSIVAVRDESMELGIRPTGDNIVIRFSGRNKMHGDLYLPDTSVNPTGIATVVAVGDACDYVKVGDEVIYDARALAQSALTFELSGEELEDHAICGELAILAVREAVA